MLKCIVQIEEIQRLRLIQRKVFQHTTMKDGVAKSIRPALLLTAASNHSSSFLESDKTTKRTNRVLPYVAEEVGLSTKSERKENDAKIESLIKGTLHATSPSGSNRNSDKVTDSRRNSVASHDDDEIIARTGSRSLRSLRESDRKRVHMTESMMFGDSFTFEETLVLGMQPTAETDGTATGSHNNASSDLSKNLWMLTSPATSQHNQINDNTSKSSHEFSLE